MCNIMRVVFVLTFLVNTAFSMEKNNFVSLEDAKAIVKEKKVANHKIWLRLLHYYSGVFESESDIDGGVFFLSDDGKEDAEAELNATLEAFYSDKKLLFVQNETDSIYKPALCKFQARYEFLSRYVQLPQKPECPVYERWVERLNPTGLTMVFASSYLNNPASVFGHTFLRIDSKKNTMSKAKQVLNYGITYGAQTGPSVGVEYAWKGIFGGYGGTYSISPYFLSIQKYSYQESRDLWEYPLNVTRDEILFMMAHLWEIGDVWMDYFFITENCSYNILTILQVMREEWDWTDKFSMAVLPAETIKLMREEVGLIDTLYYRPSRMSIYKNTIKTLNRNQGDLLFDILNSSNIEPLLKNSGLPKAQLTIVIDLALESLHLQAKKQKKQSVSKLQRQLLLRRAKIKQKSTLITPEMPLSQQPHLAFRPHRVSVGAENFHYNQGISLEYRFVNKDFNERELGFSPGLEVEALKFKARVTSNDSVSVDLRHAQYIIDEFTLINLQSNSFSTGLVPSYSWRTKVMYAPIVVDKERKHSTSFLAGFGKTKNWSSLTSYFFIDAKAHVAPWMNWNMNMGPQVEVGFRWELIDELSLLLKSGYYWASLGASHDELYLESDLRYSTSKNTSLRLGINNKNYLGDFYLKFNYHFL